MIVELKKDKAKIGIETQALQYNYLHRLTLKWEEVKSDINEAIKTSEIKIKLGLFHPIQTKQSFPLEKLNDLKGLFNNSQ